MGTLNMKSCAQLVCQQIMCIKIVVFVRDKHKLYVTAGRGTMFGRQDLMILCIDDQGVWFAIMWPNWNDLLNVALLSSLFVQHNKVRTPNNKIIFSAILRKDIP